MTRQRLPRGLRRGHDDSIACRHRDLSCCPDCVKAHAPALIDIAGQVYWYPDPAERAHVLSMLEAPIIEELRNEARWEEPEFD